MSLTPTESLRRYLVKSGLSAREFALLAGVHYSRVTRYLQGGTYPTNRHAQAMEKASHGAVRASAWAKAEDAARRRLRKCSQERN